MVLRLSIAYRLLNQPRRSVRHFGERVERLVQPRGVFSLAVSAQIIDLGIIIMHTDLCRGDRVSLKFAVVKGLDEVLKRLRSGRCGSHEKGGDERRFGH
jgi:hypothetical protein